MSQPSVDLNRFLQEMLGYTPPQRQNVDTQTKLARIIAAYNECGAEAALPEALIEAIEAAKR